eukprot:scaffold6996_cov112-Isochrysis_galbana.AAC.8
MGGWSGEGLRSGLSRWEECRRQPCRFSCGQRDSRRAGVEAFCAARYGRERAGGWLNGRGCRRVPTDCPPTQPSLQTPSG